ncbi:MAG: lactonase family protein [Flavobacterium sp.]|nr:MAG: lactonase family protein [Flavobacterium sp.]
MKKFLLIAFASIAVQFSYAQNYNLLIGTYTNKTTSEGIYTYNYNGKTAETQLKSITKNVGNPSYLALTSDKRFVYSVNETGQSSTVSAFDFDSRSGKLTFLNKMQSQGADPCYIITNGNNVIVANYSGGTIATFVTERNGELFNAKQIIKHTGKSIDPLKRQESAHVHQVLLTPDKKYLISNDLGEDKIYVYDYDPKNGSNILKLNNVITTKPGSGPRHMAFSPNGKFAYLAHEFDGIVSVFSYNKGTLTKIQDIATTAKEFKGKIDGADIHVSEDGKFVYETNRGDANTISTFRVLADGKLELIDITSTLGKGPRNFAIDPSGKFLLVAHQYTNNVVIFNRDTKTGKLSDSGKRIEVGAPVCLVFTK